MCSPWQDQPSCTVVTNCSSEIPISISRIDLSQHIHYLVTYTFWRAIFAMPKTPSDCLANISMKKVNHFVFSCIKIMTFALVVTFLDCVVKHDTKENKPQVIGSTRIAVSFIGATMQCSLRTNNVVILMFEAPHSVWSQHSFVL